MTCFVSISTIGRAAACSYARSTRRNISKPRGAHDARGEKALKPTTSSRSRARLWKTVFPELWSIFDFLMPGLLGPYARFRERFESPIVGGDDAVARRLQAIVALHAAPLEGRRAHRFA